MIAPTEHDLVESLCWCQHTTVHIYPAAVRAGQTHGCHRNTCHPPNYKSTP